MRHVGQCINAVIGTWEAIAWKLSPYSDFRLFQAALPKTDTIQLTYMIWHVFAVHQKHKLLFKVKF